MISEFVQRNLFDGALRHRVPLAVAILSVLFQEYNLLTGSASMGADYYLIPAFLGMIILSGCLSILASTSRLAILIFIAVAALSILPQWTYLANHTMLALWSIPMAVIFREWWRSNLYALYLRVLLGMVMLAAFAQKVLAGTYFDGSFIYWLSAQGTPTERLFSVACDLKSGVPCSFHVAIGLFILLWQFAVGVLLLSGVTSLIFLIIEIGFLLGAGVYADEMNFQVLLISLICVVFRVGMPFWLLPICLLLLVIDAFGIGNLAIRVLEYVS